MSMIEKQGSFSELKERTEKKREKIVCFGAGLIPYAIEELLEKYELLNSIYCFIDNDPKKWEKKIKVGKFEYDIMGMEQFLQKPSFSFFFLVTCENFEPIIQQLNRIEIFQNKGIFVYSIINYNYIKNLKFSQIPSEVVPQLQIPPTIHYCWFGPKKIPDIHKRYIESWRKYCPQYEIKFWNEQNYDYKKWQYTREAYEAGYYAFVVDVVRLDILYRFGGIYLDTDVELLRDIEELRRNTAFFTYAEWPVINSGCGCGAVPGQEIIREMRDLRSETAFFSTDGLPNKVTNSVYETKVLEQYGMKKNFTTQNIEGIKIYSPRYFVSEGFLHAPLLITDQTIAIHHCAGSWKGI